MQGGYDGDSLPAFRKGFELSYLSVPILVPKAIVDHFGTAGTALCLIAVASLATPV